MLSPLNCRYLWSRWGVAPKLKRDQLWMFLLGGDLHHGVQGLSGLNVGEAPPWGDLPQAVHVSGCDQQVADKSRQSNGSTAVAAYKDLVFFFAIYALLYLGNMWPVSLTSLHGMWCFTSGLLIHVWMFTISFLSSSDMDELSISSKRETHQKHTQQLHQSATCATPMPDCTCVVLFFISDTEHGLHPAVRFTNAVAAAHVSAEREQKSNFSPS